MKKEEWHQMLRQIYRSCRNFPGWPLIFSLHDEEDQNYFRLLEERKDKMLMEVCYAQDDGDFKPSPEAHFPPPREMFAPREIDAPVEEGWEQSRFCVKNTQPTI